MSKDKDRYHSTLEWIKMNITFVICTCTVLRHNDVVVVAQSLELFPVQGINLIAKT